MAFYSISANLSMHLQEALHEDVSVSARNVNNWVGTTFLTPLLGAFVADSFAGRYWTIASFSCGYFVVRIPNFSRSKLFSLALCGYYSNTCREACSVPVQVAISIGHQSRRHKNCEDNIHSSEIKYTFFCTKSSWIRSDIKHLCTCL